jgi:hypothetical protein
MHLTREQLKTREGARSSPASGACEGPFEGKGFIAVRINLIVSPSGAAVDASVRQTVFLREAIIICLHMENYCFWKSGSFVDGLAF